MPPGKKTCLAATNHAWAGRAHHAAGIKQNHMEKRRIRGKKDKRGKYRRRRKRRK
jgi:hypothetical protein